MDDSIKDDSKSLYMDLMKKCLTYYLWGETSEYVDPTTVLPFKNSFIVNKLVKYLESHNLELMRKFNFDPKKREMGRDFPPLADTMIGLKRLDNIQVCVEDVIKKNIPGDLIETGVWRGGGSIFMRAILKAYGITDRIVWVADSFEGLPQPDSEKYPHDAGDIHHTINFLAVSFDQVKANFAKYNLLDGQVKFLKGWFKDILPVASIDRLAVIRLDGDMYESTMDGLKNLYPKLSSGGYVIVDDYALEGCRIAVHDFRSDHDINDEIIDIDGIGAYWQHAGK